MSELDDIRQRADERRSWELVDGTGYHGRPEKPRWAGELWDLHQAAEADLDRAIEIAEGTILQLDWWLAETTLQVTCRCGNTFNAVPPYVRMKRERDQAIADVLKLRNAVLTGHVDENLAAIFDTEQYEKYR